MDSITPEFPDKLIKNVAAILISKFAVYKLYTNVNKKNYNNKIHI